MKNSIFSGLIFCSLLLAAAQTNGQTFEQNGTPIFVSSADHSAFNAYPQDNIVVLRWKTGNERDVDRYVIERSDDTLHFNSMDEVVAKGSIDQDSQDSSYSDMDSYPASPINYYRLRTIMKDGSSSVSDFVRVDMNTAKMPVLYPSVLHMGGTLRMNNYHEQPITVNFFNERGTLMGSFMVNSTSFDIPSQGWGRGIFFYRISDETHPLINAGKIMIL